MHLIRHKRLISTQCKRIRREFMQLKWRSNGNQKHYAENECAMPIRLHCNELRALCLTTNALCRSAEIGALLLKCVLFVTSEREARSEFLLIYTKNLSMSGRAAGRPWSRFWEAYISGTVSPIDKRSSLVGNPIPSAVHGTNAESCQCLLWHVARAT